MPKSKQSKEFNGAVNEYFEKSWNKLKRHNEDDDKAAEYRAKNFYPTLSFFKKNSPDFVSDSGIEFIISSGQDSEDFYKSKGSKNLKRSEIINNKKLQWGNQLLFIMVPASVRDTQGPPEIGSQLDMLYKSSDKCIKARGFVKELNLLPKRATGFIILENFSTFFC